MNHTLASKLCLTFVFVFHLYFPSSSCGVNFTPLALDSLALWVPVRLLPLHVQRQFYYPSYSVMCVQQKPTKKPTLYKISATLHGTNTAFLRAFNNAPIVQSYQHVSSLDYFIHEFGHRFPLIRRGYWWNPTENCAVTIYKTCIPQSDSTVQCLEIRDIETMKFIKCLAAWCQMKKTFRHDWVLFSLFSLALARSTLFSIVKCCFASFL